LVAYNIAHCYDFVVQDAWSSTGLCTYQEHGYCSHIPRILALIVVLPPTLLWPKLDVPSNCISSLTAKDKFGYRQHWMFSFFYCSPPLLVKENQRKEVEVDGMNRVRLYRWGV
jgi:hypothetical protein